MYPPELYGESTVYYAMCFGKPTEALKLNHQSYRISSFIVNYGLIVCDLNKSLAIYIQSAKSVTTSKEVWQ